MPPISTFSGTRLKSSRIHLEKDRGRKFVEGSVVAKIKTTYSGGSSSVFSNALNAPVESIWTSSMMYTFSTGCRRVFYTFPQLPDVIDAIIRRRIDFDHIKKIALFDLTTHTLHCPQGRSPQTNSSVPLPGSLPL